jgi:hypothetical protein
LRGKGTEIENWLQALENIAATCHSRRAGNWQAAGASLSDLGSQIDNLSPPPPDVERHARASCPLYRGERERMERSEPYPREGWHYTTWLRHIGEDVAKYCGMIDELIKPMAQACDEINFYTGCQPTTPPVRNAYLRLLNRKWSGTQQTYGYTDFFYNNTLQQYGWGNFRTYFSESAIHCDIGRPMMSTHPSAYRSFKEFQRIRKRRP